MGDLTYLLGGIVGKGNEVVLLPFLSIDPNRNEEEPSHYIGQQLFDVVRLSVEDFEKEYLGKLRNVKNAKTSQGINDMVKGFSLMPSDNNIKLILNLADYTKLLPFTLFLDCNGDLNALPNDLLSYCVELDLYSIRGEHTKVSCKGFSSYKTPVYLTKEQTNSYNKFHAVRGSTEPSQTMQFLERLFSTVLETVYRLSNNSPYGIAYDLYEKAESLSNKAILGVLKETKSLQAYLACTQACVFICKYLIKIHGNTFNCDLLNENYQMTLIGYTRGSSMADRGGTDFLRMFPSIVCSVPAYNSRRTGTPLVFDKARDLLIVEDYICPFRVSSTQTLWRYRVADFKVLLDSNFVNSDQVTLELIGNISGWGNLPNRKVTMHVIFDLRNGSMVVRVMGWSRSDIKISKHPFNYHMYLAFENSYNTWRNLNLRSGISTGLSWIQPSSNAKDAQLTGLLYDSSTERQVRDALSNWGVDRATKIDGLPGKVVKTFGNCGVLLEVREVIRHGYERVAEDTCHLTLYYEGIKTAEMYINKGVYDFSELFREKMLTSMGEEPQFRTIPVNYAIEAYYRDKLDYLRCTYVTEAVTESKVINRYLCTGVLRLSGDLCLFFKLPGVFDDYSGARDIDMISDMDKLYKEDFAYLPLATANSFERLIRLGKFIASYVSISLIDPWMNGTEDSQAWHNYGAVEPSYKAENIAFYVQQRVFNDRVYSLKELLEIDGSLLAGIDFPKEEEDLE